ncbi:MAG TPA: hypothetical protein VIU12_06840 [Chryseolinea sp.]
MIFKFARIGLLLVALVASGCGKRNTPVEEHKESATPSATSTPTPKATPTLTPSTPKHQNLREEDASARTLRERREDILSEIKSLTGSARGDLTPQEWQKVKEKYWRPRFNNPLIYGSQSSVNDLMKNNSSKEPLIEQLATGNFTSVGDRDEQKSLAAFHLLGMLTAAAGGRTLPNALVGRLNQPPTKGDLYFYEIFSDAFVEVGERERLAPSEVEAWKNVATATNPIYRLLALKTFPQVAADSSQKIELYKSYLGETDPAILGAVIDLSVQTTDPAASEFLAGLKSNPNVTGNPEMRQKIERSIEWLKTLPPKTPNDQ